MKGIAAILAVGLDQGHTSGDATQATSKTRTFPFGLFAPALLFHHPLGDGYIKDRDEILQTVIEGV